jgi:hypothetical protein
LLELVGGILLNQQSVKKKTDSTTIVSGELYSLNYIEKYKALIYRELGNGYLSYTRTRTGDVRFNEGKMKEIGDRVNM